jgi:hypothetical protein
MSAAAQELELLELRREHSDLASRFAEAQDGYEEALEARAVPHCSLSRRPRRPRR